MQASVESVDLETRQILLTDSDGVSFVVVAGPEVRNLAQLEAGDVVRISLYEAVVASMADRSDPGNAVTAVAAGRAPEGAKPGVTAGAITTLVVDFISYDPNTAIATFVGPDGIVYTASVRPEMQAFAEARKSGDLIELTIEQAVAVSVVEVGG
jgi:hypothetical protein